MAATQPVVLFTNYVCADANPHIGSDIALYAAMVQPAGQISVSVTANSTTSLTLGSSAFATMGFQTIYITDGKRAWSLFFNGSPVIINNLNILGGSGGPLAVTDYTQLALQNFTVYTGTLIQGGFGGAPTMYTRVALNYEALYDSDNDGLWVGHYLVSNLDRIFQNVQLYTDGEYNGVHSATKSSDTTLNIDAQLPAIKNLQFTTTKINYSGVLYVSALSQGTSVAQPTNALGTFTVTTNKNGTRVTVTVDPAGSSPKVLPPLYVAPDAINRTASQTWKGVNGLGIYMDDGIYDVSMGIVDDNGVAGVTITTQVRLVSLRLQIKNIVLTPASLPTSPFFTDGIITSVAYQVVVDRENGGSIEKGLRVLNWTSAGVTPDLNELTASTSGAYYNSIFNTVFNLQEWEFLRADGSTAIDGNVDHDFYSAKDSDFEFLRLFRGSTSSVYPVPQCYLLTTDHLGESSNPAILMSLADGDKTNDWDNVSPYTRVGPALAPTALTLSRGFVVRGSTPSQGNYTLRLRAILTGLDPLIASTADLPDAPDYCNPSSTALLYRTRKIHFSPSARPEGDTFQQGLGIYAEDTTNILTVAANLPPLGDSSPPYVKSSNPAEEAVVHGSDFSVLHPLSVVLQDDESAISTDSSITQIVLQDPDGNYVLGNSTTDGGTPQNQLTVYFYPLQALSQAGTYTMTINSCSVACMSKQIAFVVLDEQTPQVLGVTLDTLSTGLQSLAANTSAYQGPYSYVKGVNVRLGMGNGTTNTVDWQNSTVKIYQNVAGVPTEYADFTRVSPLTSTASAPTDSQLKYEFGSVLNLSGQFEIRIVTKSQDGQGNSYTGPPSGYIYPRFATQLDTNVLAVDHQFTSLKGLVATLPISITAGGSAIAATTSVISLQDPDYTVLGAPSGWLPLSGTASNATGFQMVAAGLGVVSSKIRYDYNALLPPSILLYYDDSELGSISETSMAVFGYDGGWQRITTSIVQNSSAATGNNFKITPPNGSETYYAYGIFYPDTTGSSSVATPTPVPFKDTRAFNPVSGNAIFRRARFYYGPSAPKEIEARVFDTSGALVRTLSLGQGINPSDLRTDAAHGTQSYWFEWDGRNDAGTLVRNGLYLVRWKVTRNDGSSDSATKPVALIK